MERIIDDYLPLEGEYYNQSEQQADDSDVPELGDELIFEVVLPFMPGEIDPGEPACGQGNNHEEHDGQEQCPPGNGDIADTEQQGDNGGKSYEYDEVVGGYLDQGISGVSPGEMTPDKDHGGAWAAPSKTAPARYSVARSIVDKRLEYDIEEKGGDAVHCKGLY